MVHHEPFSLELSVGMNGGMSLLVEPSKGGCRLFDACRGFLVAAATPHALDACMQGGLSKALLLATPFHQKISPREMPPSKHTSSQPPTIKEPVVLQPKTMRNATGDAWVCMMQLVTPGDGNKCHYLVRQVQHVFLGKAAYSYSRLKRALEAVANQGRHPFKRVTTATKSRLVALGAERGERLAGTGGTPPLVATAAHVKAALKREGFAEEYLRQLELETVVQVPHDTGEDTPMLGSPAVCTRQRRRTGNATGGPPPGEHDSSDDTSSSHEEDADYQPGGEGAGHAAEESSSDDDDDDDSQEEEEEDPITRQLASARRFRKQQGPQAQHHHKLSTQLPSHDGIPRLHIRSKLALDPAREASQELQRHMKCFEKFCKDAVVIGRQGGPVSTTTWNTCKQELSMFLGYCATHMDVLNPTLETVLDGRCLESYFASRV